MNKEEKKKFNLKDSEIFKLGTTYFGIGTIFCLFLEINLLIGQLAFKKSSLILNVIVSILSIAFYLIFKDGADDKQKKIGFIMFKGHILLLTTLFINDTLLGALIAISQGTLFKGMANVLYMLDIGLLIGFIGLSAQEGFKTNLEKLNENNILAKISGGDIEEIKPGDAVLGYVVDENGKTTKIPVILPLKDRFLHMLILGPTGCGKTSQSIIPMINRDMGNRDMGITVLEPKGDLAEKIYAMALYYEREVVYFNPILPDCPYFNPLFGKESDVVENMATTFNMLNPDSPQFFKDMSENLIRRCVKLLKRLYGNDATLLDLNTLVWDTNQKGRKMVMEFSRQKVANPDVQKENEEIISWILNDYYSGLSGQKGSTKTYEHCSGVRSQISKLVSNQYLRKVLNPPKGHGSDLDFDDAFERGIVVTMGTAQGALRDLGRYLGYFIILQLQSSVFRRPGNEFTRKHNMLYIDEFQVYSNPGFADMLTMGRSYRVASHLATQARAQIGMGGGSDGKDFVELVSTNARNKIIYPGVSSTDAKYYSEEFGEIMKLTIGKSYGKQRYFATLTDERVTIKHDEKLEARFTITDIIYRPFGHITYCIIKNNSIQAPGVSQIQYIPKDLNDTLDKMVAEYNETQFAKSAELQALMEASLSDNVNLSANADLNHSNVVIKQPQQPNTFIDPMATFDTHSVNIDLSKDEEIIYADEDDLFVDESEKAKTQSKTVIGNDDIMQDIGSDISFAEDFDDLI